MAIGALGSAVAAWGSITSTALLIAMWRFVLGVGVGGVYPLSSASAYEQETGKEDDTGVTDGGSGVGGSLTTSVAPAGGASARQAVGWANFWQQPGQVLPYAVALVLLACGKSVSKEAQYRVDLGLGALPPVVVLAAMASASGRGNKIKSPLAGPLALTSSFPSLTPQLHEGEGGGEGGGSSAGAGGGGSGLSLLRSLSALPRAYWALLREGRHRRRLAGAAGCWFLFDVYLYGVALYTPEILDEIFGDTDSVG